MGANAPKTELPTGRSRRERQINLSPTLRAALTQLPHQTDEFIQKQTLRTIQVALATIDGRLDGIDDRLAGIEKTLEEL